MPASWAISFSRERHSSDSARMVCRHARDSRTSTVISAQKARAMEMNPKNTAAARGPWQANTWVPEQVAMLKYQEAHLRWP